MTESLLSESTIWLFGRVVVDIQLVKPAKKPGPIAGNPPRAPHNGFLEKHVLSEDAKIARIYSFSFHNELFDLAKPALFIVNGDGVPAQDTTAYAGSAGLTGLAAQAGSFAKDLMVWVYDRDDFSVRFDVMNGSFDRILLEYELADEGLLHSTRGGGEVGRPSPLGGGRRRPFGRRWRSDDD